MLMHMVLRMCERICKKKKTQNLKTTKPQPNNNTDLDHAVMCVYIFLIYIFFY